MSRSKEYIAIKNFIHNEIGLSKEDFRGILVDTIKDEARAFVRRNTNLTSNSDIQNAVGETITKEVRKLLNGSSYNSSSRLLMEKIGKEISKQLNITVKTEEDE